MGDVVIIGGGIIGSATAYYLRRRGVQAVIVEKCRIACHSSGKAGGFMAPEWCSGETRVLAAASFALHREIWSEAADAGKDLGYRNVRAIQSDDGEVIGPEGTCAQVHPRLLTEYLSEGTRVITGDVTSLARGSDGRVTSVNLSDGRSLPCSAAVLCLGAWSHRLREWFPSNGYPTRTWDGGHSHVVLGGTLPPEMLFAPCGSFEVYPRPGNEVYVCAEQSRPQGGQLPEDPDALQPLESDVAALRRRAEGLRPALQGAPLVSSGLCCLPTFPSRGGGPCIGQVATAPNCFLGCGHSCWGILNGPATGKVLSDLVVDGKTDAVDITDFAPV